MQAATVSMSARVSASRQAPGTVCPVLVQSRSDGIRAAFLDMHGVTLPFAAGLAAVLSQVAADAAALGCEAELGRLRTVAAEGTSADRQLAVFVAARGDARQALAATVDWIAAATAGTAG